MTTVVFLFCVTLGAEHITIDDEPAVSAALPCLDFATTPTDVTCTQDASTAPPPPPQPDSVDLAPAAFPRRPLFDPLVSKLPDFETGRIIDQLNHQHERELLRLRDEHQSQLQALKGHHDAALHMCHNAHDATLHDVRTRVNGFEVQLQDLRTEKQQLQRQTPAPIMPDISLVLGLLVTSFVVEMCPHPTFTPRYHLLSRVNVSLSCLLITSFCFRLCL